MQLYANLPCMKDKVNLPVASPRTDDMDKSNENPKNPFLLSSHVSSSSTGSFITTGSGSQTSATPAAGTLASHSSTKGAFGSVPAAQHTPHVAAAPSPFAPPTTTQTAPPAPSANPFGLPKSPTPNLFGPPKPITTNLFGAHAHSTNTPATGTFGSASNSPQSNLFGKTTDTNQQVKFGWPNYDPTKNQQSQQHTADPSTTSTFEAKPSDKDIATRHRDELKVLFGILGRFFESPMIVWPKG